MWRPRLVLSVGHAWYVYGNMCGLVVALFLWILTEIFPQCTVVLLRVVVVTLILCLFDLLMFFPIFQFAWFVFVLVVEVLFYSACVTVYTQSNL